MRKVKRGRSPHREDYAKKRAYGKRVYRERRDAWIASQGAVCARCGTREVQPYRGQRDVLCDGWHLSHKDHSQKITHRIWTLGTRRREAELAKCELACAACNLRERHEREPVPF